MQKCQKCNSQGNCETCDRNYINSGTACMGKKSRWWQNHKNSLHTFPWWRHQMETFSALRALLAENSSVTGEFPSQRPVTRSFVVFFDLRLNKRLSKLSCDWWFVTSSRSLWRHCNATIEACYLSCYLMFCCFGFDSLWPSDTECSGIDLGQHWIK